MCSYKAFGGLRSGVDTLGALTLFYIPHLARSYQPFLEILCDLESQMNQQRFPLSVTAKLKPVKMTDVKVFSDESNYTKRWSTFAEKSFLSYSLYEGEFEDPGRKLQHKKLAQVLNTQTAELKLFDHDFFTWQQFFLVCFTEPNISPGHSDKSQQEEKGLWTRYMRNQYCVSSERIKQTDKISKDINTNIKLICMLASLT